MNIFNNQQTLPIQNMNEPEFIKRGRGRPKKNQIMGHYEKKKKTLDNTPLTNVQIKEASLTKVKDEIILHFPFITMNDIIPKNDGSMQKEKKNDPHDIFTINDGNSSTKSDSEYNNSNESNNITIIELRQLLDEQRCTINNLTTENNNYKAALNKYDSTSRNVTKIDVLLVDCDGECIIPEKTDIACWWCTHNFDDVQCVLPESECNGVWCVGGVFCTVECAAAESFARDDSNVWGRYSLLKELYKREIITPTPDKRIFTKFGGKIDYIKYKNNCHKCDKAYRLIMPPMASIVPLVEEISIDSTRVSVTMNDLKRNTKLKRTKPLPNVKDNLFK